MNIILAEQVALILQWLGYRLYTQAHVSFPAQERDFSLLHSEQTSTALFPRAYNSKVQVFPTLWCPGNECNKLYFNLPIHFTACRTLPLLYLSNVKSLPLFSYDPTFCCYAVTHCILKYIQKKTVNLKKTCNPGCDMILKQSYKC